MQRQVPWREPGSLAPAVQGPFLWGDVRLRERWQPLGEVDQGPAATGRSQVGQTVMMTTTRMMNAQRMSASDSDDPCRLDSY